MKRFDLCYLDEVTENQGDLFQFLALNYKNKRDYAKVVTEYLKSDIRALIDEGSPYHCNLLGVELFEKMGYIGDTTDLPYILSAAWLGEFYSLLQWHSSLYSAELVEIVTPEDLIPRYNVLHDMNIEIAVERVLTNWGLTYYK